MPPSPQQILKFRIALFTARVSIKAFAAAAGISSYNLFLQELEGHREKWVPQHEEAVLACLADAEKAKTE
jgi:hypothetical protein